MGETASGKTDLAEALAEELGAQLVNADSFQVYRGMDIGTAKPERSDLYRLIDIKDPNEGFGVGEFVQLAGSICEECWAISRSVVVVGGTGLNIRALFEEYSGMGSAPDPELRQSLNMALELEGLGSLVQQLKSLDPAAHSRIDLDNPVRVIRAIERAKGDRATVSFKLPPFRKAKFAIQVPIAELEQRIQNRVHKMVQNGWVLEIERLREQGCQPLDPGFRAIGYQAMWEVAENGKELDRAIADIVVESRQYAKRQRTWLRSEPGLIRIQADSSENMRRQAVRRLQDLN